MCQQKTEAHTKIDLVIIALNRLAEQIERLATQNSAPNYNKSQLGAD